MKNKSAFCLLLLLVIIGGCKLPEPKEKTLTPKHNYIILLDLSDRLIVQRDQTARDKEIIHSIYKMFEERVRKNLYIKSRDEIKVVIAPQRGSGIHSEEFEDKMYVNMGAIPNVYRRPKEEERRTEFLGALDELYKKAQFSKVPEHYYGADIWKYFYEDLQGDYSDDTLTKNFLFIITDGYPIVGHDQQKLEPVKDAYPGLRIVLIECSPRDKDLEWDRIQDLWTEWFKTMNIKDYTFIKRKAISKVEEEIRTIVGN